MAFNEFLVGCPSLLVDDGVLFWVGLELGAKGGMAAGNSSFSDGFNVLRSWRSCRCSRGWCCSLSSWCSWCCRCSWSWFSSFCWFHNVVISMILLTIVPSISSSARSRILIMDRVVIPGVKPSNISNHSLTSGRKRSTKNISILINVRVFSTHVDIILLDRNSFHGAVALKLLEFIPCRSSVCNFWADHCLTSLAILSKCTRPSCRVSISNCVACRG